MRWGFTTDAGRGNELSGMVRVAGCGDESIGYRSGVEMIVIELHWTGVTNKARQRMGNVTIHDCMTETRSCTKTLCVQQRRLRVGGVGQYLGST